MLSATTSLNPSAINHGAGPAVGAPKPPHVTAIPAIVGGAPKPVQCTSVPDTPIKGTTPANGSPAPELRIEPEAASNDQGATSQNDKNAILGPQDPSNPKRAAPEPEVDIAGPDSPELPKRSVDAPVPAPASDDAADEASEAPPGKKAKLSDKAANLVDSIKEKVTGKSDSGSNNRITKDKSRPAPGKTERKTRSQGPADAH